MRSNWYILMVNQGSEQYVKNELLKKQLEIKEIRIFENLSGYVFVCSTNLPQNLGIEAIVKFLGKGNIPQKFSDKEISKLNLQTPEKIKKHTFKVGDRVVIKHGDLSGIEGEIVEIRKRIVRIKPDLLQKNAKVKVQNIEHIKN